MGFFFFPFGFLIPIIFIGLGIRIASKVIRTLTNELDGDAQEFPRKHYRAAGFDTFSQGMGAAKPRQARIFKLADKMKGRITLSDIVLETGLDMDEAEKLIESMVDGSHVTMEVNENGMLVYEFPEIIERYRRM
ncbi:MAG: hypothetical protein ACLFR1_06245 [Spirochaetia bacterium]